MLLDRPARARRPARSRAEAPPPAGLPLPPRRRIRSSRSRSRRERRGRAPSRRSLRRRREPGPRLGVGPLQAGAHGGRPGAPGRHCGPPPNPIFFVFIPPPSMWPSHFDHPDPRSSRTITPPPSPMPSPRARPGTGPPLPGPLSRVPRKRPASTSGATSTGTLTDKRLAADQVAALDQGPRPPPLPSAVEKKRGPLAAKRIHPCRLRGQDLGRRAAGFQCSPEGP